MALVLLDLQATARGEEGMTLFFVCCNPSCGNRWRE
jgi:DNA-directed RNA polymerase II subunit RPB9